MNNNNVLIPNHIKDKWQNILNMITEFFDVSTAVIMLPDSDFLTVYLSNTNFSPLLLPDDSFPLSNSIFDALLTRADFYGDFDKSFNVFKEFSFVSYVGTPLLTPDNTLFGTLCIGHDRAKTFDSQALSRVEQFRNIFETDIVLQLQNQKLKNILKIKSNKEEKIEHLENEILSNAHDRKEQLDSLIKELFKAKQRLSVALDKEKELNDLKNRFINMISHEYRTPLTIIQSSAELIDMFNEKQYPEDIPKMTARIRSSVNSMKHMLDDVSLLKSLQDGEIATVVDHIDIIDICREIIGEISLTNEYEHILQFSTNVDHCFIDTDKLLFRHIFLNLLRNALKFSERGSNIYFSLFSENDQVEIKVQDEGIGIRQSEKNLIFDDFHKSASHVGIVNGSGLGLSIVKKCVSAIQGAILVSGEQGIGTTFTVILPK